MPITITMQPACRVLFRIDSKGLPALETKYHAELTGPGWWRAAYVVLGGSIHSTSPRRDRHDSGDEAMRRLNTFIAQGQVAGPLPISQVGDTPVIRRHLSSVALSTTSGLYPNLETTNTSRRKEHSDG
jgi:hypothetical protein